MRRVAILAAVAGLSWIAWVIVGGAAGLLYAAAAATALLGLLLPQALKRRRSTGYGGPGAVDLPDDAIAATGRDGIGSRALPGIRRTRFVKELEARLIEQEEENRILRERLREKNQALRGANDLLARHRAERDDAVARLGDSLGRHSRERAVLEVELDAVVAAAAGRNGITRHG
jgi:hypothetical protein